MTSGFKGIGRPAPDLTGVVFGRLCALEYLSPDEGVKLFPDKRRQGRWLCECICGTIKYVNANALPRTKSCGCLNSETARENGKHTGRLIEDRISYLVGRVSNYYRSAARKRGLEWNLSSDEVKELILSNCFYCGAGLSNIFNTKNSYGEIEAMPHNGIDRVDNNKGYVLGNVVPCCKVCNKAKLQMPVDEFYSWIDRVHSTIHSRNP